MQHNKTTLPTQDAVIPHSLVYPRLIGHLRGALREAPLQLILGLFTPLMEQAAKTREWKGAEAPSREGKSITLATQYASRNPQDLKISLRLGRTLSRPFFVSKCCPRPRSGPRSKKTSKESIQILPRAAWRFYTSRLGLPLATPRNS